MSVKNLSNYMFLLNNVISTKSDKKIKDQIKYLLNRVQKRLISQKFEKIDNFFPKFFIEKYHLLSIYIRNQR